MRRVAGQRGEGECVSESNNTLCLLPDGRRWILRRRFQPVQGSDVPDGAGRNPKSAFSSITIIVQRNPPSLSNPRDPVSPSAPTRPVKTSALAKLREPGVSNSQPGERREIPSIGTPDEFRRARSPADGFAARHGGKRTEALDRSVGMQGDRGASLTDLPSPPSYRSCVHLEVPPRSARSVLFLDKSLYISLVELEGRRAGEPAALYRSSLSVRFGVSSRRRSSKDSEPARINEGRGRRKEAASGRNERHVRESGRGRCRSPLSKHGAHKVGQIALTHDVNSDLDTRGHDATLGLSSLRGLSASNTKAGRREGNADEAAFSLRSNFSHGQHTFNTGRVDFRTWTKQAGSDETEARPERGRSSEPQKVPEKTPWLKADFLEGTSHTLSLKEALELLRPDFISHSQGRVRRLEQRARGRRCMQGSNADLVWGLGEDRGKEKRNCTTPDPHSDNLFKPRERTISGKEMQLRSRRIYNQLPEVTQKKEEEKKRAVSQTNRLRADVFKKKLLDQILQR